MTTFTSLEHYQFCKYREFLWIKEESHPPEFENMFTSVCWQQSEDESSFILCKTKGKHKIYRRGKKMPTFGWWLTNSC